MYQLTVDGVKKVGSKIFIPICSKNRDYQEYEKWLKEGNTPMPDDSETLELSSSFSVLNFGDLNEDSATELKLKELTEYFYLKMAEGFVWNNETFDVDERAMNNISSELMFQTQALEEFPKGFTWRGYENQEVKMNQVEFVEFARHARDHSKNLRTVKAKHEKAIKRRRVVKSIMNYVVTKDWPETAADFLANLK